MVIGFEEWQAKWTAYQKAKQYGIAGLSGQEEQEAIESLRQDRKINDKPL